MITKIVCCYKVILTDKYGFERNFHVRISYLPKFIRKFVNNGSTLTIVGLVHEEVFSVSEFGIFKYSEKLSF